MEISADLKLYLESFNEAARKHFNYLTEMSYVMQNAEIHRTELVEYWMIMFDNKQLDRQVGISYCPPVALNEQREISNNIGASVYKSDGIISFEYYMEQSGKKIPPEQLNLDNYKGGIENRFNDAIAFLAGILKREMNDVLNGSTWVSGMFPDWR